MSEQNVATHCKIIILIIDIYIAHIAEASRRLCVCVCVGGGGVPIGASTR